MFPDLSNNFTEPKSMIFLSNLTTSPSAILYSVPRNLIFTSEGLSTSALPDKMGWVMEPLNCRSPRPYALVSISPFKIASKKFKSILSAEISISAALLASAFKL